MTYTGQEQSVDSGHPQEFYQFQIGPEFLFYTSADKDILFQSVTYRSVFIKRGPISQSREEARDRLKIEVDKDNGVAELFRQQPPFYEVQVTIFRFHKDDPDAPDTRFLFRGKVLDVGWPDGISKAVINCESLLGNLKSEGMRERYQITCNHTIYTPKCGLSFDVLKDDYTVSAISSDGRTITCPGAGAQGVDFYTGGVLRFGTDIWVMVTATSGDNITLFRIIPNLPLGATVSLGRACRNIRENCINFFGNFENYLGWNDIPANNIFTGDGLKSQR